MELDELMQKFRSHHIFLIHRSIGMGAASLKGRPVELLEKGVRQRFFPPLWEIRSRMTDAWGDTYGRVRESISEGEGT
jgi:tryptophan 2,3-dioxygenase